MKKIFISILSALVFTVYAAGQNPCNNVKVISPIVAKPAQGSILSATCAALNVQWKGKVNQTYIAGASYYNTATKEWDTAYASGISCDGSQTCTATIPVKAGTKVSWSIQAKEVINGHTFYSYFLTGDRNYPVPACTQITTKAAVKSNTIKEVDLAADQLVVYPNPATGEITIRWRSSYNGTAVIAISDGAGKEVRLLTVRKDKPEYSQRISLNNLVSGLYYVHLKKQDGPLLTAKFFKE